MKVQALFVGGWQGISYIYQLEPISKMHTVKNQFVVGIIVLLFAACKTANPSTGKAGADVSAKKNSSLQFIDNVSLHPESHKDKTGASTETPDQPDHYTSPAPASTRAMYKPDIENFSLLQFKYAILIDASVEEMDNEKLLNFIDEWYGARYQYGGSSKDGIDCSAFVFSLVQTVYGISTLPRMAKDQYNACRHIKRSELREGDLVFFHTMGRKKAVTHVGMYLRNNKFIHASISGVIISSLDDG